MWRVTLWAYVNLCAHVCTTAGRGRRGHLIPWNQSARRLWAPGGRCWDPSSSPHDWAAHTQPRVYPAPGLLSFPVCLSDEMNWWNVQTFVTGFFYWACFQRPFVSILCPSVSEEYSVCLPSYLSGDQWMSIWLVAKNHHVQVSVWTWCSAQGGCLIRSGLAGSYGKST